MRAQDLAVRQFDADLRNGDTDSSQWAEPLEDWQLTEIITAQAFEQEINDIFSAVARYIHGEGKDLTISQIISGMSQATRESISQAIDTETEDEAYQRGVRFYAEAIEERQAA